MKKFYIFVLLSVVVGLSLNAQNVYIPDANFKAALLANHAINTNTDTAIQVSEAQAYTGIIDVHGKNISDLTGIEAFTAITGLDCYNNNLTSLNVSSNTALAELDCDNNSLTALDISANTSLVYLYCYSNNITSLNVSANTALNELDCNTNGITVLDVSTDTALTYLACNDNNLASLLVTSNKMLNYLDCFNNGLTSLNVSSNPDLTHLDCYHNNITELDLSSDSVLSELFCNNNNLISLNVKNGNNHNMAGYNFNATNNTLLTCIEVDSVAYSVAHWTHIDPQASFSNNCHFDSIVYIPDANFKAALVGNPAINLNADTSIQVIEARAYSGLIDVPGLNIFDLTGIEAFTAITGLNCYQNLLTSLNVTSNRALTDLDCSYNSLISLNVSSNVALINLVCYNNSLTNLDVSGDTVLNTLDCYVNSLTSLDVSSNKALTYLDCDQNNITTLDVSSDSALTYLDCSFNKLTSLNVKNGNNQNMDGSSFWAMGNENLTCIQVDDVTYSTDNWVNNIDPWASFNTDCNPTSAIEMTPMTDIYIYPNPALNQLAVGSRQLAGKEATIEIYNLVGQKASPLTSALGGRGEDALIDISALSPGIYLLQLKTGSGVAVKKFVKE